MEKKRIENEAYCRCVPERPFLRTMLCLILNCFTSGHANGIALVGLAAIEQITPRSDAVLRARIIERLREKLNQQ